MNDKSVAGYVALSLLFGAGLVSDASVTAYLQDSPDGTEDFVKWASDNDAWINGGRKEALKLTMRYFVAAGKALMLALADE